MKTYFISADVHSFFSIFHNELKNQGFDINNQEHHIIICGDAFDRGEESKELLDFLYNLHQENRLILVRGNHDDLFQDMLIFGPKSHDFSNGTVKTLAQLQLPEPMTETECKHQFVVAKTSYDKRLDELHTIMVDYAEIGNYIFVHGWIPGLPDTSQQYWWWNPKYLYDPNWRDSNLWNEARWRNGMDEWKNGIREPGKTIVCGHWHCSYGWSHIDQKRKEFPEKNKKNFLDSFEIWRKESPEGNIIALDACTAYSGKCNVLKLTEEEMYEKEN